MPDGHVWHSKIQIYIDSADDNIHGTTENSNNNWKCNKIRCKRLTAYKHFGIFIIFDTQKKVTIYEHQKRPSNLRTFKKGQACLL